MFALGLPAPFTYADFAARSSIRENAAFPSGANDPSAGGRTGGGNPTARTVYPLAERIPDQVTADLLTERMHVHERTAWMLRSLLS